MGREYGNGSLMKRRGRWYGQLKWREAGGPWRNAQKALVDKDGAPIPCEADTNAHVRAARDALRRWRDSFIEGMEGPRPESRADEDMADYLDSWASGRAGSVADSTLRGYREYARLMAPHLRGVAVSRMDAQAVRSFMRSLAATGCKPRTMLKAYNLLRMAMDAATDAGDAPGNPCTPRLRRECMPRVDSPAPNALDPDGIRHALEVVDAHGPGSLRTAARVSLMAGLRRGEVAGLRWRDVDLTPGAECVHVRGAVSTREGGTYEKPPKSRAGRRDVPLVPELAAWLAERRREATSDDGGDVGASFVVEGRTGGHVTPQALSRAWARVASGGPSWAPVTGHTGEVASFGDLRHTFATSLLRGGADVRTVAALMGHEDPSVTLRHYAAFMPAQGRAAVERAARAIQGMG